MAVAPVKNVPKNPYGSLGPSPGTVKKITPPKSQAMPYSPGALTNMPAYNAATSAYQQSNLGIAPAVAAPPAAAPPAASTPGYWNTPNYKDLLAGDWEPEQAAIKGQQMQGQAEADFQLALRRAFIDYGGDASGLDEKYRKYIDAPTIEAAKNNKFSTMAQNLQASTKSLNNQRAKLAARGMTSSGANQTLTRQQLQARELADYTAGRTFTGGAEEGLSGLAKTQASIADMIAEAKSRAAARIAQENPQTWIPGTGPDYSGEAAYTNTPAAPPPAAAKPAAGTVNWNGTPMNAQQLAAELARTGVNRATWINRHPGAAATLGWA